MRSEQPPRTEVHQAANPPQHDVPRPPGNPAQERPREGAGGGPQYRLRGTHIIEGRTVPKGTVVGDGGEYPWDTDPSNIMEGVNDAGKRKVNELHQRLYGVDAPWHDPKIQRDTEEDLKKQEEQRKEEEDAEPVSHAQAAERDKEWKGRPDPYVVAKQTGAPVLGLPSVSGDTSANPGLARPRINQENIRVERPLEEQLPRID
jgi:hypothetical protein